MTEQQYKEYLLKTFLPLLDGEKINYEYEWNNIQAINLITNKPYTGVAGLILNQVILPQLNTKDPRFASFNNISYNNMKLKKGSKAVFYIKNQAFPYWDIEKIKTEKKITKPQYTSYSNLNRLMYIDKNRYLLATRPHIVKIPEISNEEIHLNSWGYHSKIFPIFHASQIEGIQPYVAKEQSQKIALNDFVINASKGLNVEIKQDGGRSCYYSSIDDSVHLPIIDNFKTNEGLQVSVLHELAHSTGIEKRLNRECFKKYNESFDYRAQEEFVAEMSAVILRNDADIKCDNISDLKNHAAYIQSWRQALNDKTGENLYSLFKMAEKASYTIRNAELEIEKKLLKESEEELNANSRMLEEGKILCL